MGRDNEIGIRELKNSASRIVGEVRERGADYVITHRGQPVAVIRPWREQDSAEARRALVARTLAQIETTSGRVARAAGRRSAAAAVSRQRR